MSDWIREILKRSMKTMFMSKPPLCRKNLLLPPNLASCRKTDCLLIALPLQRDDHLLNVALARGALGQVVLFLSPNWPESAVYFILPLLLLPTCEPDPQIRLPLRQKRIRTLPYPFHSRTAHSYLFLSCEAVQVGKHMSEWGM